MYESAGIQVGTKYNEMNQKESYDRRINTQREL